MVSPAFAAPRTLYVASTGGSDANAGTTLAAPLATLQRCVQLLAAEDPGSECRLRGGEYRMNTAFVEHLHGTAADPYVIGGYGEEEVTIVGTDDLTLSASDWTWTTADPTNNGAAADHWSATLPNTHEHPWQLYVGGELYMNARWPNGYFEDRSAFSYETAWAKSTAASTYVDDPSVLSSVVDSGSPSLAAANIDATGASAILNIGHWYTFAQTIDSHTRGTNTLYYYKHPKWSFSKFVPEDVSYYLENKLEFLDTETEWWYDQSTRKIHVKTRGDVNPATLRVQIRVQDYAIRICDTTNLRLEKIKFFMTTVWAASVGWNDDVTGITYHSLRFEFGSAQKRMLGDVEYLHPTTLYQKNINAFTDNKLFNCTFYGGESDPQFYARGAGNIIENSQFLWNDWSCVTAIPCWPTGGPLGDNAADTLASRDLSICDSTQTFGTGAFALISGSGTNVNPTIIKRNTIAHFGPSAGIRADKNSLMELNHVHHNKDLQQDGALIQTSAHDRWEVDAKSSRFTPDLCDDSTRVSDATACGMLAGCSWDGTACSGWPNPLGQPPTIANDYNAVRYGIVYHRNWLHDSRAERTSKRGLRFDRDQKDCNGLTGDSKFTTKYSRHGPNINH